MASSSCNALTTQYSCGVFAVYIYIGQYIRSWPASNRVLLGFKNERGTALYLFSFMAVAGTTHSMSRAILQLHTLFVASFLTRDRKK